MSADEKHPKISRLLLSAGIGVLVFISAYVGFHFLSERFHLNSLLEKRGNVALEQIIHAARRARDRNQLTNQVDTLYFRVVQQTETTIVFEHDDGKKNTTVVIVFAGEERKGDGDLNKPVK